MQFTNVLLARAKKEDVTLRPLTGLVITSKGIDLLQLFDRYQIGRLYSHPDLVEGIIFNNGKKDLTEDEVNHLLRSFGAENEISTLRKVYKSTKSGRFFKFVEYCDDGYGKYEDIASEDPSGWQHDHGSVPSFHSLNHEAIPGFRDHERGDIEEIVVEIKVLGSL